jgi:hypothetical protein
MSKNKKGLTNRLPRNFHKSFMPERQYLNAILRFVAKGGSGDIQQIASETGIPTGVSSGKVDPTLDYCRGMGLITIPETRSAIKSPELTPFGRIVMLEDPFLKESLTQWLAHFHLCDINNGAEMWFQMFNKGGTRLGLEFSRDTLEEWLAFTSNVPKGGLIGPLVRMYEDDAAFKNCGVLAENNGIINRKIAPINNTMALGYGVWLIALMESIAKPGSQLTTTEIEEKCGWISISGWSPMEIVNVLNLIENKGLLSVDRQMNPWILKAKDSAANFWRRIFEDLL